MCRYNIGTRRRFDETKRRRLTLQLDLAVGQGHGSVDVRNNMLIHLRGHTIGHARPKISLDRGLAQIRPTSKRRQVACICRYIDSISEPVYATQILEHTVSSQFQSHGENGEQ